MESLAAVGFVLLIVSLPGSIAPMSISVAWCGVFTTLVWLVGRFRPDASPVLWPAAAWLLALALSSAFAIDPSGSWRRVTKAFFPALVPLVAFHASNRVLGGRALSLMFLSSAIASAFGVILFVSKGASFASRARGLSGHYMTFGGQLLLIASIAVGVALMARTPRWRWGAAATAAIAVIALVCTYTRSAWMGFVVSCFVMLAIVRRRWLPAMVAAIALGAVLAPAGLKERLASSFQPGHVHNRERTLMWEAGGRMFRDRPWTGVGLQDLRSLYPTYRSPEAHETPGHLHSNLVQIAASMGVVGLIAFALLYGSLFVAAASGLGAALAGDALAAGVKVGVLGGLAGFFVAGMFEWNFGDEELLYLLYSLVGLAWGARLWSRGPATTMGARTAKEPEAKRAVSLS